MRLARVLRTQCLALLLSSCVSLPASFGIYPVPNGSGIMIVNSTLYYCAKGSSQIMHHNNIAEKVRIKRRGNRLNINDAGGEKVTLLLKRNSDGYRMIVTDSSGSYTHKAHIQPIEC